MSKTNNHRIPSAKELVNGISNSPYYNVAWIYLDRKGIIEPDIADILEAYHEIAKIDNKLNQGK